MKKKDRYYGYIEEIWELDYGPNFKVPLFRCQWVKLSGGGVTKDEYVKAFRPLFRVLVINDNGLWITILFEIMSIG